MGKMLGDFFAINFNYNTNNRRGKLPSETFFFAQFTYIHNS
jgi:hypothetical protein